VITLQWGEIPYQQATEKQQQAVQDVLAGGEDRLIFCSHPPVVTLGRGTKPGDVTDWQGQIFTTSRGGRATYHGPNQLVIYPICDLRRERAGLPPSDLRGYLQILGLAVAEVLQRHGIQAQYRTLSESGGPSVTGVWVEGRKIASIGIAVRKWVTYHGVAINLYADGSGFSGIYPCGFTASTMTSIEELIGQKVNRDELINQLDQSLRSRLQ